MSLPVWATAVANPDDQLCECGLLPYLASVPLTTANGRHRQSTRAQLVCRACLMLEQASREGGFREAQQYADALIPPEQGPAYTREGLLRIFRINFEAITAWIQRGWLRFPQSAGKRVVPIAHADVVAFMRNPATWMAWDAGAMPEGELRRWAMAYRAAWPWRWMSFPDIRREVNYSVTGLRKIMRAGLIPYVVYASRWYSRSDEVGRFCREVLPQRQNGTRPVYGTRMLHAAITAPESHLSAITAYGAGNLSAGVRRLWEEHQARQEVAAD